MKKILISASVLGFVLQGFFAAPALAQTYNYSGYAYPSSYFPQPYQYQQYPYNYPYNYNYQYGYQNCYNGYNYNCYPYQNQYYNYPPSITGVSGPTQLIAGQTGTWSVQVGTNYNYGYPYNNYGGNLTYSVSWGDEGSNPYASAYNNAVTTGTLSHTYIYPGTYTARFTVTNASGQSTSASATVVVYPNYQYQYPYQPYVY